MGVRRPETWIQKLWFNHTQPLEDALEYVTFANFILLLGVFSLLYYRFNLTPLDLFAAASVFFTHGMPGPWTTFALAFSFVFVLKRVKIPITGELVKQCGFWFCA